MNRSKFVAILTGAISILLALAYLIVVVFLDSRGEMKPAPISSWEKVPVENVSFQSKTMTSTWSQSPYLNNLSKYPST